MAKQYSVNEIFYSIQGEGARSGTANVFVRFAGCNLKCSRDVEGFDCDTDFASGMKLCAEAILEYAQDIDRGHQNVIYTGGEPTLQVDQELSQLFHEDGWTQCIETNGTNKLPPYIDWVSASPKSAEHTMRCGDVDELRYVRADMQALPKPSLHADHYYLSPVFNPDGSIDSKSFEWCRKLVLENPPWKLSLQSHKLMPAVVR